MAEPPNQWDMLLSRIDRLEDKIDRVGERVVPRDEFERYKAIQSKEHDALRASIKELDDKADAAKDRQDENAAKWRLFWSGLALTPVASGLIAWIISGGVP